MDYNRIFLVLTLAGLGFAVKQAFPSDPIACYAMLAFWVAAVGVALWPYGKWAWNFLPHRRKEIRKTRESIANQRPINEFALVYPARFPNLKSWDRSAAFTLGEIAALWLDQEPEMPLRSEVKLKFRELHAGIYAGRLKPKLSLEESMSLASSQVGAYPQNDEDPIHVETKIGREELRRYALTTKDRPMFLFKDARAGKHPNE